MMVFYFLPKKNKAILEKLLTQENRVLEYWTAKKKRLDQTQQYCLFERSARQSLAWIKVVVLTFIYFFPFWNYLLLLVMDIPQLLHFQRPT